MAKKRMMTSQTGSGLGLVVKKKKKKVSKGKRKSSSKVGLVLRNVIDHLKSDSYMYAPLCYSPPNLLSYNPPTDVSLLKKEEDNKTFYLVSQYLKSDDYMYAPLLPLLHQPSSLSLDQNQPTPSTPPHFGAEEVMEGPATPASYEENRDLNILEVASAGTSRIVGSRMLYHHQETAAVKQSVHQHTLSLSSPQPTPVLVRRTRRSRNVIVD